MPTVLRTSGFQVRIYTDDHVPMHVHIIKADEEAVIYLGSENEAPNIRENRSMKPVNLRRALRLVAENQAHLIEKWREIHG